MATCGTVAYYFVCETFVPVIRAQHGWPRNVCSCYQGNAGGRETSLSAKRLFLILRPNTGSRAHGWPRNVFVRETSVPDSNAQHGWPRNVFVAAKRQRLCPRNVPRGGPPYMECMFRVEGTDHACLAYMEHIRRRGYGSEGELQVRIRRRATSCKISWRSLSATCRTRQRTENGA